VTYDAEIAMQRSVAQLAGGKPLVSLALLELQNLKHGASFVRSCLLLWN